MKDLSVGRVLLVEQLANQLEPITNSVKSGIFFRSYFELFGDAAQQNFLKVRRIFYPKKINLEFLKILAEMKSYF